TVETTFPITLPRYMPRPCSFWKTQRHKGTKESRSAPALLCAFVPLCLCVFVFSPNLIQSHLIDDPNNCRIDRRVFTSLCHARRTSLDDDHVLAITSVDGVNRDEISLFVVSIRIYGTANEQLLAFEARILARGDDRTDDASEQHRGSLPRC